MSTSAVTQLFSAVRHQGNSAAVAKLWNHYERRLTALARVRLNPRIRRVFDEDDLASVAFNELVAAATAGQYDEIRNRDDLWRLLAAITANRARDRANYESSQKRGRGHVRGDSALPSTSLTPGRADSPLIPHSPHTADPSVVAALLDQADAFVASLDDETLEAVARLKLQGFNCDEISAETGVSKRSVVRKLSLIRRIWTESASSV